MITEAPLRITVPLEERYDCQEGESITLICECNKPNIPAMWLKDGEQITVADGYDISIDGCRHTLSIPDVYVDHEAQYTVMIGTKVSSGELFVEGELSPLIHSEFAPMIYSELSILML